MGERDIYHVRVKKKRATPRLFLFLRLKFFWFTSVYSIALPFPVRRTVTATSTVTNSTVSLFLYIFYLIFWLPPPPHPHQACTHTLFILYFPFVFVFVFGSFCRIHLFDCPCLDFLFFIFLTRFSFFGYCCCLFSLARSLYFNIQTPPFHKWVKRCEANGIIEVLEHVKAKRGNEQTNRNAKKFWKVVEDYFFFAARKRMSPYFFNCKHDVISAICHRASQTSSIFAWIAHRVGNRLFSLEGKRVTIVLIERVSTTKRKWSAGNRRRFGG
jgi:hypothetical protein